MKIAQDKLNEIIKRLIKVYHPVRIILFGSQAWSTPNESSDVDLLVVVDESSEPSWKRARMGYKSLFGLGMPCDLVVRTTDEIAREGALPTSWMRKITAEGQVLYG